MGGHQDEQAGRFVNCRISKCNLSVFYSFAEIGAFLSCFSSLQLRTFSTEPPFAPGLGPGWISAPAAGSPLMHDMATRTRAHGRWRGILSQSWPVARPFSWAIGSCGELCAGKGQVKGVSGCIMALPVGLVEALLPAAHCCMPRHDKLPACESNRAQIMVGSARSPTFTAALFAPNVDPDLPESEPSSRLGKESVWLHCWLPIEAWGAGTGGCRLRRL